ncbi:MAG: GntR family transcriptional regulator [Halioglobus sp.]
MNSLTELFPESKLHTRDGEAPTPLYFRLYSLLRAAIIDGTIAHAAQMPTEQQLSEYFDVSRITAKRAMDELAAERLVERQRGRGTHVIYNYRPQPVKAPLVGMLEEIESMARHSEVNVLECKHLLPPARVRADLGLAQGEKALLLQRVRSRDGQPFAYYSSWTAGLAKSVSRRQFSRSTRLEVFRKQGLEITHVTQTITAVAATAELASHLSSNSGEPLLHLLRKSYITAGKNEELVDILEVFYHPDRFQYQMDLQIENP